MPKEAVSHSGDVMRADGGRHEITVHLPKVKAEVTARSSFSTKI